MSLNLKQDNDFLKWFATQYPDLFDKYLDNIDLIMDRDGRITVNADNKISPDEIEMLKEKIKEFKRTE